MALMGPKVDGMEEMAEYVGGSGVARYDHDPSRIDALLGQKAGAVKVHAVSDALGSVYALADGEAELVSRYAYDVYGERTAAAESIATKFGFTGRVHDTGAGDAMYFRARYLDSATGRWNAPDPLGMIDGPHLYTYVADTPANAVDPSGLLIEVWCRNLKSAPGISAFLGAKHCGVRVWCDSCSEAGVSPADRVRGPDHRHTIRSR
jgi:RHS repeat-associated protein